MTENRSDNQRKITVEHTAKDNNNRRAKNKDLNGFTGMNFEQQRGPYIPINNPDMQKYLSRRNNRPE